MESGKTSPRCPADFGFAKDTYCSAKPQSDCATSCCRTAPKPLTHRTLRSGPAQCASCKKWLDALDEAAEPAVSPAGATSPQGASRWQHCWTPSPTCAEQILLDRLRRGCACAWYRPANAGTLSCADPRRGNLRVEVLLRYAPRPAAGGSPACRRLPCRRCHRYTHFEDNGISVVPIVSAAPVACAHPAGARVIDACCPQPIGWRIW